MKLSASIPVDLDCFSLILAAAPNLIRVDLPFDCLINFLEIEQMRHLLVKRIESMSILQATVSSQITINEEHIRIIASYFRYLPDLFVALKHLQASTTIESNEIEPSSMESMILSLLSQFKRHKLSAFCVCVNSEYKR